MKIYLTLLLLTSLTAFSQDKQKVKIGDKAFDFVGYDKNGKEVKISDYQNKRYVLLNFTALGCGPCWPTYNQMNSVQEKYKDQLKVISFHHENEDLKDKWFEMAARYKIDFQCTAVWNVIDKTRVFNDYQVPGFPYFFLIDKNGNIVGKWWGGKSEESLEKKIKKYINKPAESFSASGQN
jgi:peroxiredoxin